MNTEIKFVDTTVRDGNQSLWALNMRVGVMLTAFGIFWAAEGAGVAWPHGDLSILALLAFVIVASKTLIGGARVDGARPTASTT